MRYDSGTLCLVIPAALSPAGALSLHVALPIFPLVLAAQSPESDQRITQALISEIQQLRLAIERSTLLNTRTQLALSRPQVHATALQRHSALVYDPRAESVAARITAMTERIRET